MQVLRLEDYLVAGFNWVCGACRENEDQESVRGYLVLGPVEELQDKASVWARAGQLNSVEGRSLQGTVTELVRQEDQPVLDGEGKPVQDRNYAQVYMVTVTI